MNRNFAIVMVLVVAVALGMVGVYYYLTSTLPLTPEVPPEILSDTSYIDDTDSVRYLIVDGEIQNNLKSNVNVNVTATFYDAENNLIGDISRGTMLKILKPRQRSPFEIVWPLSPSTEVLPRYELSLSYAETSEEPWDAFEILYHTNRTDEKGYYVIGGEILNKGNVKAFIVAVICTYYDSEGDVMAISRTAVSYIGAGCKAFFELSSEPRKINPASYGLLVVATRYESLVVANYELLAILIVMLAAFVVYMKRRGW